MKYLNLGCGAERPQDPEWTNLDNLHSQLPPGGGARVGLDRETNYLDFVIGSAPLPFEDNSIDGILASHFFEHWNCQEAVAIMQDCKRILAPGGVILVSVPDATYFRKVYPEDTNTNWPRLYDTHDPRNPTPTFFECALFFNEHRQILTEDSLWCHLVRAGFPPDSIERIQPGIAPANTSPALAAMIAKLNRPKFSLVMAGVK
jgi:predicted SAM-dependent methyltransferase